MRYRILADVLAILHFAFVGFVVLGGFLAWRWRRLAWVHLPAAAWGALIEFTGWICPLTPLENHWRRLAGSTGYAGGFVEHYLLPVLYPPALTPRLQVGLGLLVVVMNAVAYGALIQRWGAVRTGKGG